MTVKELSRLKDLNSEIDLLEEQKDDIHYALQKMPANYATSVTGSLVDAPYTQHTIRIGGVIVGTADMESYAEKRRELKEIKALIELRQQECFIEYTKLIRFINGVGDSLMRQILTLRFVNNLPWVQVAASIGGNTEASVKMAFKRYLESERNQNETDTIQHPNGASNYGREQDADPAGDIALREHTGKIRL